MIEFFRSLKGTRTVLINSYLGLMTLLLATLDYLRVFDWSAYMEPKSAMYVILAVNLLNIVLRFITDTPVFEDGDEDSDL